MTIEDEGEPNLGSVIYENILGNERFFYGNPDQMLKFRFDKLNTVFVNFNTIQHFKVYGGLRQIKITLEDKDGGISAYLVPFNILVPNNIVEKKKQKDFKLYIENEEVETCKANIVEISDVGLMKISFSKQMNNDTDLQYLNETVIDMWIETANNWHLREPPEKDLDLTKLNFTWTVVNFTDYEMMVQLDFKSPLFISLTSQRDYIVVDILSEELFKSKQGKLLDKPSQYLKAKIQPQMPNTEETRQFKENNISSKKVLMYALGFNLSLQTIASGGLQYMVSMINALQMILHLPIMSIQFPSNTMNFYQAIKPFVAFDILDNNEIFESFFHFKDTDLDELNISDQAQKLGYESHNPILNLGVASILTQLYVIKLIIVLCILYPMQLKFPKLRKYYEKIKQFMFYKEILILIIEGFIEFLFAGVIILKVPEDNQDNNYILIGVGILYLIVCLLVIPIIFGWIINQKMEYLRSKQFEQRWGTLIESIKLNSKINVTFYFFFCLRRILFISAFVLFSEYPIFQILTINYLNLIFTIYQAHFRPIITHQKNLIEIINETYITICCFSIMIFTNFVPDIELQSQIGMVHISIILSQICLNMMVVLWYSIKSIWLLLTKYFNILKYYFNSIKSYFITIHQNLQTATQIDGDIYRSNQKNIKKQNPSTLTKKNEEQINESPKNQKKIKLQKSKLRTQNLSSIQEESGEQYHEQNVQIQPLKVKVQENRKITLIKKVNPQNMSQEIEVKIQREKQVEKIISIWNNTHTSEPKVSGLQKRQQIVRQEEEEKHQKKQLLKEKKDLAERRDQQLIQEEIENINEEKKWQQLKQIKEINLRQYQDLRNQYVKPVDSVFGLKQLQSTYNQPKNDTNSQETVFLQQKRYPVFKRCLQKPEPQTLLEFQNMIMNTKNYDDSVPNPLIDPEKAMKFYKEQVKREREQYK